MQDISKLKTINVGIVGHIDHGKTTLLQRLSGKWADTHSEELKRGITIKLGYADAIVKDEDGKLTVNPESKGKPVRYITFVDAPGHEMLMATMLSGAAIMDAAILVVAANEGIKPQTQEHLVALKSKKIKKIIIVQNKIDLVSKERALENYKTIKEFVKGTIAENATIIPVSAIQGVNIDKILKELIEIKITEPEKSESPLFLVARSFDINKPGTPLEKLHGGILGGALKQGTLKIGDTIEIKPGYSYKKNNQYHYQTMKSKIISMQKGEYQITKALPGGSLAIETELDPSLTKADALSGGVASTENILPEITENIKIKYTLFDKVLGTGKHETIQNIKPNEMLMLSLNTSITVGQVTKTYEKKVDLSLKIPVVPLKGESIGIARNLNGHWRLIGFGSIE
ncbi:translation initiation factor IF-2 subunit gamma [archaeon]|jgi:translation initiation factor 2 subunit 3|nr:translation initiation factor IF-2 subunit gamma [archaeon]MBT7128404.1 translation initiation factor IF-2 subunit gamma [archaeon]